MSYQAIVNSQWRIHPGEILREKLTEMNLSVSAFSALSSLDEGLLKEIVALQAPVTPDLAVVLEKTTHIPAHLWTELQADFDQSVEPVAPRNSTGRFARFVRFRRQFQKAVMGLFS